MAITQVGAVGEATCLGTNANTGSESISVHADAEIIIVGLSGFRGDTANYFSAGAMTIGGQAMTALTGGDTSTGNFMGGMFYKVSPPTGTQTLAWDWAGAAAPDGSTVKISWVFFDGIDTGGAIRDTDGVQGVGDPRTSGTLTAQSGDKIVAWIGTFCNNTNLTYTWASATELAETTNCGDGDGSWATADPTGNQTVSATASAFSTEGAMMSMVLIAAAAGTSPGVGALAMTGTVTVLGRRILMPDEP